MTDDLDLFSCEAAPADVPIAWRRLGEGTFWFIESKSPTGYRIEYVTSDGHRANTAPVCVGGHSHPAGEFFQAAVETGRGLLHSPLYPTPEEAKSACEYHRRFRIFPSSQITP